MKALYLIFTSAIFFTFSGFTSPTTPESDFQTLKKTIHHNSLTGDQIDIHYVSEDDYLRVNHCLPMTYDEYGSCVYRRGNCGRTNQGYFVIKPISDFNQS